MITYSLSPNFCPWHLGEGDVTLLPSIAGERGRVRHILRGTCSQHCVAVSSHEICSTAHSPGSHWQENHRSWRSCPMEAGTIDIQSLLEEGTNLLFQNALQFNDITSNLRSTLVAGPLPLTSFPRSGFHVDGFDFHAVSPVSRELWLPSAGLFRTCCLRITPSDIPGTPWDYQNVGPPARLLI